MKKTLTLLGIGLALGMASQGATVSSNQTDVNQAGFTSFNFTLNNVDWLTSTEVLTPEVLLDSLDITTAATWYRGNPMGLAIYQSDSPNQWNYVGKSEWNGDTTSSGNRTFNFGNLEISSSTTYTAVFYGSKEAFDALATGNTLSSLAGGERPSVDNPLAAVGLRYSAEANHESMYTNEGTIYAIEAAPIVSFHVSNVPEPATASLGLFGLAALIMRRRRA